MSQTSRLATITVTIVLIGIAVAPVAADVGGQIVGFAAAPLGDETNSFDDIPRGHNATEDEDLFGGLEGEIWFDRFGFGLRYAGRFERLDIEVVDGDSMDRREAWWYDGQSDLFAAFHFFGGGSFFDPYLRYGIGYAARYRLNERLEYDESTEQWTRRDDENDDTTAEPSYDQIESGGMYQYIGAGAQINLSGLVLGVGVNYNVLHQQFGAGEYEWQSFPKARFETRVYGGVAFK